MRIDGEMRQSVFSLFSSPLSMTMLRMQEQCKLASLYAFIVHIIIHLFRARERINDELKRSIVSSSDTLPTVCMVLTTMIALGRGEKVSNIQ